MAEFAGDMQKYPLRSGRGDRVQCTVILTVGASGAVGSVVADDPRFAITKEAGTGTYSFVFPKCARVVITNQVVSAAGTVRGGHWSALDAAAGTATYVTANAGGTATNPADGDRVQFDFALDTSVGL